MIKAIIFDMDGTIVLSEPYHRRAFNALLRKYGIYITAKVWTKDLVGTSSRYIAKRYITKHKLPEDVDDFVQRRKEKYRHLVQKYGLRTVPGFHDFFNAVKKRGFKIIIASSGSRKNVEYAMRAIKLKLDHVCIEDVHHRKPNPELFLKAARKLRVKPSDCLVIEDSVPGVTAAKRAKMEVVALTTTSPVSALRKLKPDLLVKNYNGLVFEELV
jgi:beta-phosphoglucomutase